MMFSHIFAAAALAAGAGLISAQSISPNCETALAAIAASPDAACLNPSALVSLVLGGNSSIISPVDNWLTGLCALGPCSNSSLAAVVTNITTGCSTELSAYGISSSTDVITSVQAVYPLVREVVCLKDTSARQLCVTQTLTNVQNIFGTLSLSNIPNVETQISASTSLPSSLTCTNCIKQAYNLISAAFPSQVSPYATSLQTQCGSNFTDGSTPSGISELATTTSTSSSSNAALRSSSLMMGGPLIPLVTSTLIIVFTGFAFLA